MTSDEFLIWSFEHDAWWRVGGWGYTSAFDEAGRFSQAEADTIVRSANLITVNEIAVPAEDARTYQPPPSYLCPRCRRRSFNPTDIREQYCGACHEFERP